MFTEKLLAANIALITMVAPVFAQDASQTDPTAPSKDILEMDGGAVPGALGEKSGALQSGSQFIASQSEGQWLVNDYIGRDVVSSSGETVAEIDNIIVNQDGKIGGFTLSVGGFLGLGDRVIAVPAEAIHASADDTGNTNLMLNVSVEQLEAAPEYVTLKAAKLEEERMKAAQESEQMNAVPDPAKPSN